MIGSNDTMTGYLRDIQRRLTFLERQPARPYSGALTARSSSDLEARVAALEARVTELEGGGQ